MNLKNIYYKPPIILVNIKNFTYNSLDGLWKFPDLNEAGDDIPDIIPEFLLWEFLLNKQKKNLQLIKVVHYHWRNKFYIIYHKTLIRCGRTLVQE